MQITFLGATQTVTGSKYLLSHQSKNMLIDCGLFQGLKELRLRNWNPFPINASEIDAVILTHAHIDHSGYLPLLVKKGFTGKIYSTFGTKDLCAILLPDSGHIQEEDAAFANKHGFSKHRPALPLYTREDALQALKQFHPLKFGDAKKLFDAFTFSFYPAGHIIGSSMVKIESKHQNILFTGDLGRQRHLIMKPPASITSIDYLVIESTYGNRLHDYSNPLNQLATVIQETIHRGGSVIIPAFAVGRTQEILFLLYQLKKARRIPEIPIFLDSPMAQDVSDLLINYSDEHQISKDDCKKICAIAKYIRTAEESKSIDQYSVPSIIISASGMAEGGRVLHHLKMFLPHHQHTILFTGYQDPGTRGDRLIRGETEIKIHGQMVPVKAKIIMMQNMSAHADYQETLTWLKNFTIPPKKTFITHGNTESASALKEKIEKELGWACHIPKYLETEILK